MFQKLLFPAFLFISIVFLSFNQLYAQEEEIIIISDEVGEVIDLEERSKYNLFPAVKGFQSAVFLKLSDENYVLKITYLDSENEQKVKRIPQSESRINYFKTRIDHVEGIQARKYQVAERPPPNAGRIAGELLAGGAGGFVASLLGAYFFMWAETAIDLAPTGEAGEGGMFFGLFVGSTVGSSIGVYAVGKTGNETGSYWVSLLGSAVGMGTLLSILLSQDRDPSGLEFWIGLYALPTLGGITGFNMTRRYETLPASGTAFVNFRDGQMSLAVPTISFRPNPFDKKDFIQNVDLVKVTF